MLECEGLADYTVTSDGLNCTDPKQLKFCKTRDKLLMRSDDSSNHTDGLLGLDMNPPSPDECRVESNVTLR
jgi:hypothetical protein